jgi:hypothetical protein
MDQNEKENFLSKIMEEESVVYNRKRYATVAHIFEQHFIVYCFA